MKHLFAPYELALLAKEKAFNEPCLAAFIPGIHKSNNLRGCGAIYFEVDGLPNNSSCHHSEIAAPLYQQLVDWFDSKGIVISIYYAAPDSNVFTVRLDDYNKKNFGQIYTGTRFNKRANATCFAITEAFKRI